MSPVMLPLTYDDLQRIQREENKSRALTPVRQDFYPAMTELRQSLHDEYEKLMAKDPDSIMCEGMRLHSKKADTLCKIIASTRAQKICNKAVISADGGTVELDCLTEEELVLFSTVQMAAEQYLELASVKLMPYTPDPVSNVREVKRRDRRPNKEKAEMKEQIKEYRNGFTTQAFAIRFSMKQDTATGLLKRWKDEGILTLIGIDKDLHKIYRASIYTGPFRLALVNVVSKVKA